MANKIIDKTANWLVLLGGVNVGLAVFNINLVTQLIKNATFVNVVYGAIGLSAAYLLLKMFKVIKQ